MLKRAGTMSKPTNETTKAAKRDAAKVTTRRKTAPKSRTAKTAKPALLSGGNPQIAKAHGEAPVQAYIAAMPGWKREIGRRLDALIVGAVPGVAKAIKWNSRSMGSRARAGSSACIASRNT
jgi:hypothetical protein